MLVRLGPWIENKAWDGYQRHFKRTAEFQADFFPGDVVEVLRDADPMCGGFKRGARYLVTQLGRKGSDTDARVAVEGSLLLIPSDLILLYSRPVRNWIRAFLALDRITVVQHKWEEKITGGDFKSV